MNAYDIAWSYLPNIKTTDVSSLGILNIGSSIEMAYRDNRTLRLMAHVGIIGNNQFSFAETFHPYPPTRIVIENGRKKLQSGMRMLHDELALTLQTTTGLKPIFKKHPFEY